MSGLNKYDEKERRKIRRRNHIARDLFSNKYRQQIVPDGKLTAVDRKRKFINTEDEAYYDDSTDIDT